MTKGEIFRALHQPGNPFILANAWDIGSARMLAAMGAKAIATSSAAHAFTIGKSDLGHITRDEALDHAQQLVAAVDVPVSGDFENGFGQDPDTVAETVRLAAEVGLAGICIEDTALPATTPYDRALSIERIRAGAAAARALPNDFFFVARADGVMLGSYDHAESIARIQGYEAAGADGVYVPIPANMDDLAAICAAVSVPVNALAAGKYAKHTVAEFAAAGAARISLGAALARATHRVIHDAGVAMFEGGEFTPLTRSIASGDIDALIT